MSDQSFQAALAQGAGDAGLRQAAALIHALAPADRRWAIAQLPAQQRDTVEALLAELTTMGLPRERAIVEAALQQAPVHDAVEASSQPRAAVAGAGGAIAGVGVGVGAGAGAEPVSIGHSTNHVDASDDIPSTAAVTAIDRWVAAQGVPALVRTLSSEPVALLARLLTVRDWAWRAEAVRHLQPALRQDVVEAMRLRAESDAGATAADARLLDLLAQRLDALHPVSAGHAGPSSRSSRNLGSSDGASPLGRLLSRWRAGRSAR
ncbi:hypothetical protein [Roseateles sp.]|uniref:hypothetical protein n=1 Tax=Roseateles sp. TaxID=1971397 RepID=UPI002F429981